MYHIALCDDEQAEVIKTQEMLSHYKKLHPEVDFDIGKFENTEQHALKRVSLKSVLDFWGTLFLIINEFALNEKTFKIIQKICLQS